MSDMRVENKKDAHRLVQLLNNLRGVFAMRDQNAKRLFCEAVDDYRSSILTRSVLYAASEAEDSAVGRS
jgi:hypothetical protein